MKTLSRSRCVFFQIYFLLITSRVVQLYFVGNLKYGISTWETVNTLTGSLAASRDCAGWMTLQHHSGGAGGVVREICRAPAVLAAASCFRFHMTNTYIRIKVNLANVLVDNTKMSNSFEDVMNAERRKCENENLLCVVVTSQQMLVEFSNVVYIRKDILLQYIPVC